MKDEAELRDFVQNGHLHYVPHVSIDCAIFGYHDQQLKLLLIKHKFMNGWCLPGGYILRTETLVEAAARIVRERTGVDNLFLQQFKTFGDPHRPQISKFDAKAWAKRMGIPDGKKRWVNHQNISVGFYAITDFSKTVLQTDFMSSDCAWFDIEKLPRLEFDHDQMVKEALHTLRIQLYHYPIGYNLLPGKFTLTEIRALYETLLGKKLDVSNFPKKLLALGLLNKLAEKRSIGAHRSPYLYSFNKARYNKALKEGMVLS